MECVAVECRIRGSGSLSVRHWDEVLVFTFGAWCRKRDELSHHPLAGVTVRAYVGYLVTGTANARSLVQT